MGILDGIGKSSASSGRRGNYFAKGLYIAEIKEVSFKERSNSFVIECQIVGVASRADKAPEIGDTVASINKLKGTTQDQKEMWLGNWKAIMIAMLDIDEEKDDEEWEEISDDVLDGGLNGVLAYVETYPYEVQGGKNAGNMITLDKFHGQPSDRQLAFFNLKMDADGKLLPGGGIPDTHMSPVAVQGLGTAPAAVQDLGNDDIPF